MSRKSRSKLVETEDKITVIFDEQTEAELFTIMCKVQEITQQPLTEQQVQKFVCSLLNEFLGYSDDISKLEDWITETAELLIELTKRVKEVC